MKQHYHSIQVLRGFLFLLILAFHCGVPFASFGWAGVEAFFVISAFFLVKKYYGTGELSVRKQFVHRVTRLYPPYVMVLIIAVVYALLKKSIPFDLVTHLLSGQNYQWMVTGYSSPMQPMTAHTWTLSIEVWTGVVLLLLLRYLTKMQFKYAMYAMFILGILYRTLMIILGCDIYLVSLCPVAHFDAFACGSLLAIRCRSDKMNRKIGIFCVLGLMGIVTIIYVIAINNGVSLFQGYLYLSSPENYLNNWFTGNVYLFIALLVTGLVGLLYLLESRRKTNPINITRCFVRLGDYSYVLYLFHWPIRKVVMELKAPWYLSFTLIFMASIIAAFVFNHIFKIIKKRLHGGMKNDSAV